MIKLYHSENLEKDIRLCIMCSTNRYKVLSPCQKHKAALEKDMMFYLK